jgi:hypothetical protein
MEHALIACLLGGLTANLILVWGAIWVSSHGGRVDIDITFTPKVKRTRSFPKIRIESSSSKRGK